MRFVDDSFLLLSRGGRTPHALPMEQHPPGDPGQIRLREERELLNRVRQPRRSGEQVRAMRSRMPVRPLVSLAVAVAGLVRRGGQLDA